MKHHPFHLSSVFTSLTPLFSFGFGSDLISGWVHQEHRADLAQRKDLHLTSLRKQFTLSVTDQSDMSTLLVVALQKKKRKTGKMDNCRTFLRLIMYKNRRITFSNLYKSVKNISGDARSYSNKKRVVK